MIHFRITVSYCLLSDVLFNLYLLYIVGYRMFCWY